MEILNTTTTRIAKEVTDNGEYNIEYYISNEELNRVNASIYVMGSDKMLSYLGAISYENDIVNCSLPVGAKSSIYFQDFESIMEKVKADVQNLISKKNK